VSGARTGAAAVHAGAPWWVRWSRTIIQRLPAGRFRAAALVARRPAPPFVARFSPDRASAAFWCDLGDAIARDVCLIGEYEPQVSRVVLHLLAPGQSVIDAGANWGYFTLLAAARVAPAGRVLALEPDPRVFDLLQRNLALNDFPHVTALAVAAGRSSGTLTLQGYEEGAENRGVSRVSDTAGGGKSTFTVRSEAIDDLADAHGLARVDLLKIDVEGAEDGVLAGMSRGLMAGRYARVLIELHPGWLEERGLTADQCCDAFRRAGYSGWAFDHSAGAVRRAAYSPSLPLSACIHRSDRVPADDPWPHMLWTAPGVDLPLL
jgi:FkbM family methyltransferase